MAHCKRRQKSEDSDDDENNALRDESISLSLVSDVPSPKKTPRAQELRRQYPSSMDVIQKEEMSHECAINEQNLFSSCLESLHLESRDHNLQDKPKATRSSSFCPNSSSGSSSPPLGLLGQSSRPRSSSLPRCFSRRRSRLRNCQSPKTTKCSSTSSAHCQSPRTKTIRCPEARKCLRRSLQEDISSTMHTPYSSFLSNSCESNPEKRSRIKSNVLFPAESLPSPKPCRSISFTDGTITEDLLSERFNTMDRSLDADSTEEISFISQSSLSTQMEDSRPQTALLFSPDQTPPPYLT